MARAELSMREACDGLSAAVCKMVDLKVQMAEVDTEA